MISIGLEAVDNMTPVIRGAEAALSAFEGRATSTLTMLTRLGKEGAGIGAIGVGFIAIGTAAAKVEQQVANLNAVMRATPQQLRAIRDEGLALAQVTQFTEQQIISAQRLLAKAGSNTSGILSQTPAVLNLASATTSDPTAAAQVYVAAQKVFQLSNKDSTETVDILAQAVDSGVGTIGDLGTAFKQIGPVAQSAGIGLRETSTAVEDLMNAGLRGDTGTALKTFIQRIQHETPQAKAEVDALGLSFYDQAGKLKPLGEIYDDLRLKTIGLTQEQKNYAGVQIFGQRGVRVFDIATEQGSQGLVDTASHMNDIGSASDIAREKLDTLEGSIHKLGSSINTLAVQGGQSINPLVRSFVDMSTAAANALSTASRANPVVPQLGVGGLALFGELAISSKLEKARAAKADDAAEPGRVAAAAQLKYSEQIVQAEFTADSQVAAAHQELTQKIIDLDEERYQSYLSTEAKLQQALVANEAKKLELLQSSVEKQLTSIAEVDAAMIASQAKRGDIQALDFAKQDAMLALNQETAKKSLALDQTKGGFSPEVQLDREQALQREALSKKRALDAEFAAKYGEISDRTFYVQRDKIISNAEQLNMQIERTAQTTADATIAAAQIEVEAQAVASEMKIAGAQRAAAAQVSKAEAGLFNVVGSDPNAVYTQRGGVKIPNANIVEGSAQQGLIGSGSAARSGVPLTLVTDAEKIDGRGLLDPIKSKVAGLGALAGEMLMPLLIAVTAKQLIFDPLTDAIAKKLADGSFTQRTLQAQVKIEVVDDKGQSPGKVYADAIADAQIERDKALSRVADLNGPKSGVEGLLDNPLGLPSGIKDVQFGLGPIGPTLFAAQQVMEKKRQAEIQSAQDDADAQQRIIDIAKKNQTLSPDVFKSDQTARAAELAQQVRDGTITAQEATDQYSKLAVTVNDKVVVGYRDLIDVAKEHNLTQDEANRLVSTGMKSFQDQANAAKQDALAIEQANQAKRDGVAAQIEQAKDVVPLGASSTDVLAGIFGITADGQKASAAAVKAAKKDLSDLSQAWNQAAQAINAVDISKGAAGLADANEGLVKARDELSRLGLSQSNLNNLTDITKIFKDIADQEQKADSAMNGYLLTLNHTSDAMKNISTLKGQFLDALNAAQDRVLRGTSSQSDLDFIKQAPSIIGTLDQQGRNVSQGSTEDLLNIAKNLPNFTQQVNDFNRAVKDAGGGQNIILKVQAETLAAKQDIKNITDGKYSATIDVGLTFNGLSAALGNISGLPPIFRQILGLDEGLPVGSASSSRKTTTTSGGSSDMQRGIPGGTWNQYHSLSQPDYMDIVKSGSIPGKTSPFEDPSFYGAVLRAAQENGVDPRALLAFTKSENHNATDIGAGQLAAKNYGGLKYVGQPLAHQGTEVPIDEQGPGKPKYYAAFDTIDDFFDTLAQNLTTGQYADAYKKGDLAAVSRMYVGSDEPTRVNDYNTYASKYPAAGDDTGFGGDAGGGALIDGKANSIRQQIVQKALSDVDIDKMVAYCEQWVEETIQAVTGRRGAVGVNQEDANTALATAQKMNLVTNNPQPGDLVYYGDANKGHVAIYMGGGKQVSTWDKGAFPGNTGPDHSSGTGAANAKIHTEDVGPGAIYVSIPGLPDATKGERSPAQGKSGTIQAVNQQILNGTGTQNKPDAPILPNVQKELDAVSKQFQNMAAVDITNVINATNSLDGAFTKLAQHNLASAGGFVNGQGPSTASEQTALNNEQLREGLVIEQAYAVVVNDIANGKTDITDDEQKLLAVSGALGPMLVAELDTRNKIAIVARQTKLDQDALTGLEATHNADLKARATTDENESRRRTREQWGQQDYETNQQFLKNIATWQRENDRQRITDKYDAEKKGLDDTWTKRSRQLEDEQRLLDFQGTSQKATLDQQLVDMDKAHKLTTANMQATEQLLRGQTTGGGDRNARNNAKEVLAIQMDYDKRQNDAYTKSRQSVQDAIDAQSRLVSLERYNFETQKLAETRKHEDDLKKIADAQTADNKKWANEDKLRTRTETMTQMFDQINQQNKARGYQEDDWKLADLRKKTDDKYESDKAALNFKITNEQEQSKLLDDVLSKTLAVEQAWSRTADSAGSIVSGGPAHDSGRGGGSTGTFVRRLGGYASGTSSATAGLWAIAEKEPEIVAKGNEKIMPLSEYLGTASSNGGGDTTIHNHLHFDSGMEAIFDAEGMARMKQVAQEETARMLRADRKKTLGSGSSTGARRRTS